MNHLEEDQLDRLFARDTASADSGRVEDLQNLIAGDLKPVRQLARPAVFAAAFVLIAVVFLALSTFIMPSFGWDLMTLTGRLAIFATIASSASLLAFALALQMVPGSRVYWSPGLLIAGIIVLMLIVLTAVFQVRATPHFLRSGVICVRTGTPFAIPAAILFAFLLRRGFVLSPRRAGMITGMLAGLVAMAVLEVHCPNFDLLHIITWHFGIPIVGAVLGYLLGLLTGKLGNLQ